MNDEIVYKVNFTGLEYDWIAVDEDGHIGFFSSAGFGFLPKDYLKNPAYYENEYFEEILLMNPSSIAIQINDFESVFGIESVPDEFVKIATRGIYAFDWQHEIEKYQLIAKPDNPINSKSINEFMRQITNKLNLSCNFEKGHGLDKLIDHHRSGFKKWMHEKKQRLVKEVK